MRRTVHDCKFITRPLTRFNDMLWGFIIWIIARETNVRLANCDDLNALESYNAFITHRVKLASIGVFYFHRVSKVLICQSDFSHGIQQIQLYSKDAMQLIRDQCYRQLFDLDGKPFQRHLRFGMREHCPSSKLTASLSHPNGFRGINMS